MGWMAGLMKGVLPFSMLMYNIGEITIHINKEKSKESVDIAVSKMNATNLSFVNCPEGVEWILAN